MFFTPKHQHIYISPTHLDYPEERAEEIDGEMVGQRCPADDYQQTPTRPKQQKRKKQKQKTEGGETVKETNVVFIKAYIYLRAPGYTPEYDSKQLGFVSGHPGVYTPTKHALKGREALHTSDRSPRLLDDLR